MSNTERGDNSPTLTPPSFFEIKQPDEVSNFFSSFEFIGSPFKNSENTIVEVRPGEYTDVIGFLAKELSK